MPQALAVGAQLVLAARVEPFRVLGQGAQLVEAELRRCRVARQRLVRAPRGQELAPRLLGRPEIDAREGVEDASLVRGTGEPALLELAAHRDRGLGRRRDVLPGRAAAPRVRARAAVLEDAAGEHDALLAVGPELRQRPEGVVVEPVELCLDIRLLARGSDQRRVALGAEQQADRVREDRLPRPGLAGDRVQARRELELCLLDEDEVRDAQRAEHPPIVGRAPVGIIGRRWRRSGGRR